MTDLSKNAGEWSELYVLLNTLGEGVLYSADGELNKLPNNFCPVISITMQKAGQANDSPVPIKYIVDPASKTITLESGGETSSISMSELKASAGSFFAIISSRPGRAFQVPEISPMLDKLKNPVVKQSSSKKADIHIVLHDVMTGFENEVGFSIKSKHKTPSTLLNPSGQTLFQYRITGIDQTIPAKKKQAAEAALSKNKSNTDGTASSVGPKDRVKNLIDSEFNLEFVQIKALKFRENIKIIDTSLDVILAECLKIVMAESKGKLPEVVDIVAQRDPCKFNSLDPARTHDFYKYKMQRLLVDIALGMQPAQPWSGQYDASGGYIVVKETGDVVCFHLYNWNALQDYLYENMRFESPPSTSAGSKSSFNYALYYEDESTQTPMMDICLQLRFK